MQEHCSRVWIRHYQECLRTSEPKSCEKFRTDKRVLVNQLHIVVVDKEQKGEVAIDVAIPADSNTRVKEHEKMEEKKILKEQLEQMWKLKCIISVISYVGINPESYNR